MAESPTLVLSTPSGITALATLTPDPDVLITGSQDGSVRMYRLPDVKVKQAVRPLGDEIASLCLDGRSTSTGIISDQLPFKVWVATGKQVYLFGMNAGPLLLDKSHAIESHLIIQSGEDDNVLNQIATQKSYLAYSCDSGEIGILDLSTKRITSMKRRHSSICSSVSFVPDRPKELVSGGFDNKLLHFDLNQGSVLSSHEFYGDPTPGTMTLSPPFILGVALSPGGTIAAATADGRIWIGRGGNRTHSLGTKKRRKWNGLSSAQSEDAKEFKVAEGPVVSVTFFSETVLVTLTLSGIVRLQKIPDLFTISGTPSTENERAPTLSILWQSNTYHIKKTNALAVAPHNTGQSGGAPSKRWITVGGVGDEGKGFVEVWSIDSSLTGPWDS